MARASLDPAREAALLELARSGSARERAAAFDEIFRELREPILALCVHLTGNRADAKDALQEVFLAVHTGLASFRGESRLGTWAYRIAIRIALRTKAGARRRAAAPLVSEPSAPAVPDALVAHEERDALARALASLSAEHRSVISLFAIDGLGHEEIASILGVPTGTVWSRLHAARKKLAAALEHRQSSG